MEKKAIIVLGAIILFGLIGISIMCVMSKKGHSGEVRIPNEASYYKGKDYSEVVGELKSVGFSNIKTEKIEDLITGWLTSDGEVESVSVAGNSDFSAGKYFEPDAEIIVAYHTFPEKSSKEPENDYYANEEETGESEITPNTNTNIPEEIDNSSEDSSVGDKDEIEETDIETEDDSVLNIDEYRIDVDREELISEFYQVIVTNDYTMQDVEKGIDANRLVVYEIASDNSDNIVYYNISTVGSKNGNVFSVDFGDHDSICIQYDKEDGSMYVELLSPDRKRIDSADLHRWN